MWKNTINTANTKKEAGFAACFPFDMIYLLYRSIFVRNPILIFMLYNFYIIMDYDMIIIQEIHCKTRIINKEE